MESVQKGAEGGTAAVNTTTPSTDTTKGMLSKLNSTALGQGVAGAIDLINRDTRQQYINELDSALTQYAGARIDPDFIAGIDDQIALLTNNPDAFINKSSAYKQQLDALEQTVNRTLIAQGHNPAESGYGATELAKAVGSFRQNYINNERDWLYSLRSGQDQFAISARQGDVGLANLKLDSNALNAQAWGSVTSGLSNIFSPEKTNRSSASDIIDAYKFGLIGAAA